MKLTGETVSSSWRGDEADDLLVMGRHAANAGRGVVPPLLIQEKCLMDQR